MQLGKVTPILRIFDEAKALEFYVDFLGFKVDWQHRFEANFPLYLQVSLGECVLHLSEHHGDASPGAAVRIRHQGWMGSSSNCRPRIIALPSRASRKHPGARGR